MVGVTLCDTCPYCKVTGYLLGDVCVGATLSNTCLYCKVAGYLLGDVAVEADNCVDVLVVGRQPSAGLWNAGTADSDVAQRSGLTSR